MRPSTKLTVLTAIAAILTVSSCASDDSSATGAASGQTSAAGEQTASAPGTSESSAAESSTSESSAESATSGSVAGQTPGPATGPSSAAGWTFVDDTGATIELDEIPDSVVADEGAAAALIEAGVPVTGIFASATVTDSLALQGLDLTGIEILGEVAGEVDVEKVLELEPDVIVAGWYKGWGSEEGYYGTLYGVDDLVAQLQKIAPFIGIDSVKSSVGTLERYAELAQALGADSSAAPITESKPRFDAAVERLQEVAAQKTDVEVAAYYFAADYVGVGDPAGTPEFIDLASWGVNFVPVSDASAGWAELTWETIDTYQPDLALSDYRTGLTSAGAALESFPTLSSVKAIEADQWGTWYIDNYNTYDLYAAHLEEFTAALEAAQPLS